MSKTYLQAMQEAVASLTAAGVPDASIDAWYLLSHVTGMTRARYFMDQRDIMEDEKLEAFRALTARRSQRIPLQHLLGEAWFMGLPFYVNENVLIPRQDTEKLVELILDAQKKGSLPKGGSLLDMCTGSGCIAISLERLGDWQRVFAADISEKALEVAKKNAEQNASSVDFRASDLFAAFAGERFDLIVSNPPYIPTAQVAELMPEVRDHDPMLALDGHGDGLYFYRRLADECRDHLEEGGSVFFEIGWDQGAKVRDLLLEAGYVNVRVEADDTGKDRIVTGEWKCLIN